MENYKEKINKLQTQLDELKSKIEKPYTVGKWYKCQTNKALYYVVEFNGVGKDGKNYGFDYNGNWMELNDRCFSEVGDIEATPKEVEEALTKEAVKRFPIGTKFESVSGLNEFISTGKFIKGTNWEKCLFRVDIDGSKNGIVFENGTWATPIKTKTIDELASEFKVYADNNPFNNFNEDFKAFCIKEKIALIETLNNL